MRINAWLTVRTSVSFDDRKKTETLRALTAYSLIARSLIARNSL